MSEEEQYYLLFTQSKENHRQVIQDLESDDTLHRNDYNDNCDCEC